jgi:hypothetical protein
MLHMKMRAEERNVYVNVIHEDEIRGEECFCVNVTHEDKKIKNKKMSAKRNV